MTTAMLDADYALTVDEILTLTGRLGIDTTPEVLALWPTQPTIAELERAHERCAQALAARDLIVDGEIDQDLAHALSAMRRPDREMSIRLVTAEGLLRAVILRLGRTHVIATRRGDSVRLRAIELTDPDSVIGQALRLLPKAIELQCGSVSALATDMAERLAGIREATALADELHALGADHRSALQLGALLANYQAAVEIRVSTLDSDTDRSRMVDGAVAVFYSDRGSVLSAPSLSADGQLWCSVKGGSGHRVGQAIAQLMSLLPEGW